MKHGFLQDASLILNNYLTRECDILKSGLGGICVCE